MDVSGPAAWSAARDSVKAGLAQLHETLALGHEAQAMLVAVQALARNGEGGQDELNALITRFSGRVDAAVSGGLKLAAGESLSVQAEPGADPVAIAGADLRVKAEPGDGDIIQVSADARADQRAGLAHAVQRSLEALQEAMAPLLDAARALEAHQGFLGAVENASVRGDLDADGARLMALQVRQGLQSVGAGAIANVEPQAVLSLFRA
ncbi:MAG: hypothetical protein R3C16_08610 [Hyphomonadaceae bacterium]